MKRKRKQPELKRDKINHNHNQHCAVCGKEISVRMYRTLAGFCKECYKLYFE